MPLTYATLNSSGSSPWQVTNGNGYAPMNIGFAVTVASLSSRWQIDVIMTDPTGVFPSTVSTIFQASQVGGPAASSVGAIGAILQPIAAWRLTNNSTSGSVHVAALQQGIG